MPPCRTPEAGPRSQHPPSIFFGRCSCLPPWARSPSSPFSTVFALLRSQERLESLSYSPPPCLRGFGRRPCPPAYRRKVVQGCCNPSRPPPTPTSPACHAPAQPRTRLPSHTPST